MRAETERLVGSRVTRALRVYGGYGPSATFRLTLADGRRAFFKSSYPTHESVKWAMPREAKVYRQLGERIAPWGPRFFGAFEIERWYVLVLEDLGPGGSPRWTPASARRAARAYAAFHASTVGDRLPRWLSRTQHHEFGAYWGRLAGRGEVAGTAGLARRRRGEAEEWLDVALPVLRAHESKLRTLRPPFALLHFDTRSDNVRLQGEQLRIFDWPFASVGPHEFDLAAFAQSIAAEGGPLPERVAAHYAEVLPLRDRAMDASVAGIAGYFADRAWRPPVKGLPRLRSIQRRQLKATLGWAARRFALPEPRWLSAVAD
ncbi:MAG: phosphotransferase [Candidatus Limnocylindria bacterium]